MARALSILILLVTLPGCNWTLEDLVSALGWTYALDATLHDSETLELSKVGLLLSDCLNNASLLGKASSCVAEIEDDQLAITLGSTPFWGYRALPWQKTNKQAPDKKYFSSPGNLLSLTTRDFAGNMEALDIVKKPDTYYTRRKFTPLTMQQKATQPADQCHNGLTSGRQFSTESTFQINSPEGMTKLRSQRIVERFEFQSTSSAHVSATEIVTLLDTNDNELATGISSMEYTILFGKKPGILLHQENTILTNAFGQQQQTIVLYVTPMLQPNHLTLDNAAYKQQGQIKLYIGPPVPRGHTADMQVLDYSRMIHYLGYHQVNNADGTKIPACKFTESRVLTDAQGQEEVSEISTVYAGNNTPLGGSVLSKVTTNVLGSETLGLVAAELFKKDSNDKTELIAFIKPKIVR